jgi:hypothetical protein
MLTAVRPSGTAQNVANHRAGHSAEVPGTSGIPGPLPGGFVIPPAGDRRSRSCAPFRTHGECSTNPGPRHHMTRTSSVLAGVTHSGSFVRGKQSQGRRQAPIEDVRNDPWTATLRAGWCTQSQWPRPGRHNIVRATRPPERESVQLSSAGSCEVRGGCR